MITRAVLFSLSGLNCAKAQGLDPGIVHDGRYTVQSVPRSSIVRLIDLDLIVSSLVAFHLIIVVLGVHAFNVQCIVGVDPLSMARVTTIAFTLQGANSFTEIALSLVDSQLSLTVLWQHSHSTRSRMGQGLLKGRVDWAIVLRRKTGLHTQTLPVNPHKSPWPCPCCDHAKHVIATDAHCDLLVTLMR